MGVSHRRFRASFPARFTGQGGYSKGMGWKSRVLGRLTAPSFLPASAYRVFGHFRFDRAAHSATLAGMMMDRRGFLKLGAAASVGTLVGRAPAGGAEAA